MQTQDLVAVGLNPLQAAAYAQLIEHGEVKPPELAIALNITRTNAYKLLDKLVEMKLAVRQEQHKKIAYQPGNPAALAQLTNEARSRVAAQEQAMKSVMDNLLERYYLHIEQPSVSAVTGRTAVADAYRNQGALHQPIYFIRSQTDIPSMGYDFMHEVRTTPARHNQKRYGITPDTHPSGANGDARNSLTRTWLRREDYTAPVEWSVCGSNLLIVLFGAEPHVVTINSPVIADAFRQIWHILDTCLRSTPYYTELPRENKPLKER